MSFWPGDVVVACQRCGTADQRLADQSEAGDRTDQGQRGGDVERELVGLRVRLNQVVVDLLDDGGRGHVPQPELLGLGDVVVNFLGLRGRGHDVLDREPLIEVVEVVAQLDSAQDRNADGPADLLGGFDDARRPALLGVIDRVHPHWIVHREDNPESDALQDQTGNQRGRAITGNPDTQAIPDAARTTKPSVNGQRTPMRSNSRPASGPARMLVEDRASFEWEALPHNELCSPLAVLTGTGPEIGQ